MRVFLFCMVHFSGNLPTLPENSLDEGEVVDACDLDHIGPLSRCQFAAVRHAEHVGNIAGNQSKRLVKRLGKLPA